MKFSVATVVAAAGLVAATKSNVTYVTEVVTSFTTYCPGPTQIVHNNKTYTVTEATTLTITDCPCTITKPVITTSSVACNTCHGYTNSTGGAPGPGPAVTSTHPSPGKPTGPAPVPTAGAAKVAGLSGLAGLAGLAAYLL